MERVRVDLMSYLFGDVLSVGSADPWFIFTTAAVAAAALAWHGPAIVLVASGTFAASLFVPARGYSGHAG